MSSWHRTVVGGVLCILFASAAVAADGLRVVAQLQQAPAIRAPLQVPERERVVNELRKAGARYLDQGYVPSWAPDGNRLVFGRRGTGDGSEGQGLTIYDLKAGKSTDILDRAKDPAWQSKEGKFIAFVTGRSDQERLWLVNPSGEGSRQVADGGFPSWSADGKTLYYHNRRGKIMALSVNAEGAFGDPREFMDFLPYYPALSRDAKQVASRESNRLLVRDRESGRTVATFPLSVGSGFLGSWSPDGKRLGFGGWGSGDPLPMVIADIAAGQCVQVATGPATMPVWSPDGSKIAFDVRFPASFEIWMIDNSALDKLTPGELPRDRYAVPSGGVAELVKFLEELKAYRPKLLQERSEHEVRARSAMRQAAEQILRVERDESSPAFQTALLVLLGQRIRGLENAPAGFQQETVEHVKSYLSLEPEGRFAEEAAELAMTAALALETNNAGLSVEAYRAFAEILSKRKEKKLQEIAKKMEQAARRWEAEKHQ